MLNLATRERDSYPSYLLLSWRRKYPTSCQGHRASVEELILEDDLVFSMWFIMGFLHCQRRRLSLRPLKNNNPDQVCYEMKAAVNGTDTSLGFGGIFWVGFGSVGCFFPLCWESWLTSTAPYCYLSGVGATLRGLWSYPYCHGLNASCGIG